MARSKGPFAAHKFTLNATGHDPIDGAIIVDSDQALFAFIPAVNCIGADPMAALARATRIAESLNKTEGHAS